MKLPAFPPPNPFLDGLGRDLTRDAQPFAEGVGGSDLSEYEFAAEVVFAAITKRLGDNGAAARKIFARLARRGSARKDKWAKQQRLIKQIYRIKRAMYEAAHGPLLGDYQKPFAGPQTMGDLAKWLVADLSRQKALGLPGHSKDHRTVERRLHELFRKWKAEREKHVGL